LVSCSHNVPNYINFIPDAPCTVIDDLIIPLQFTIDRDVTSFTSVLHCAIIFTEIRSIYTKYLPAEDFENFYNNNNNNNNNIDFC